MVFVFMGRVESKVVKVSRKMNRLCSKNKSIRYLEKRVDI